MFLVRNLHFRPQHLTFSSTCFAYYRESPVHTTRRRYVIQSLCNGFLDLAIALPIPPSLPAYSTTIIVLTVATRLALLPVSIWAKQRTQRLEELVLPELEKQKPIAATQVFEAMKAAKVRGDKKDLKAFHAKKTVEMLHEYRKKLYKKHKCQPWPSIIVPPLAQLPVFVTFTVVMQRLSLDPTPFDAESFLTLMTLAHPDPTGALPIILGIITLANVESSQWVMNATEREQAMKIEQLREQKIAQSGERRINPGKLIKTSLRGLSVFRIMIAMIAPGSVTLYWVTSATLGLFQTWIMDWLHLKRKRRRIAMSNGPSMRAASGQRHQ